MSVESRLPVLAGLGMVALGLAVETLVLVVVAGVGDERGTQSLFYLVETMHGGLLGFSLRAMGMGAFVAAAAWAAPAWARSFAAGPVLGLAAWILGVLVDSAWHGSLDGVAACLVLGGLPALFVGTTMPLFVRHLEQGRATGPTG
jgi:hypothetical protein